MKAKLVILFLLTTTLVKAQLTIKGKVVDQQNQPMPFVNVYLKNTTNGTTTDDDGMFSFSTNQKRGILEISFIGFQTQSIKINPRTTFLNITLKEEVNELNEIVIVNKPKKRIKKEQNPAYKILKEIWKRKKRNGLDLAKQYQYKKHITTEIGLNNLDSTFLKTLFKNEYNQTIDKIDYDSNGNYYIPIYAKEKVLKIYGNNETGEIREDIEAEKEEGLGAEGFAFDRMLNAFNNIDVFKNNITLLNKSFVSPISTDGFATYKYLLYDSIVKNNKKLYNIYFFPIRDEDLAFQGNFLVDDTNFSISEIKMKTLKGINLNFVRELSFEKEFEIKDDSIYISTKNKYKGDFTLKKENTSKGLTIEKTVVFDSYILNKPLSNEFYSQEIVKIRPNQFSKNDSYWNKLGGKKNANTYSIINEVKNKRKIKKLTGLINTLSSGYANFGNNIQIGPLWTTFAQNEIEGFRAKIGMRTFKTTDDRFRISGYTAYGFKDKKIKYAAEARYLLSYKPRITIGLAYQNDVEQLGSTLLNTTQLLGNSFGSVPLFSRGNNYFLSKVKKVATNFDYAIHPNFHVGFTFTKANITSAITPDKFNISYSLNGITNQNSITDVTSDTYIAFTPGRFVYGLGVEQQFGKNIFPTLVLNYKHGYKNVLNGSFSYDKLQFLYSHPILLGKFGLLDATVEGGKTFGKVPLSLLSIIPANQSLSLVKNTFALINYYDFVTDTYLSTHLEHHFNGFILNRVPLVKDLKLRSLITFRAAYGTISDENKNINRSSINYNAPSNKIYYEYGFGLENIGYGNIRFFRIDAIWRSNYTAPQGSIATPTPKFAIRIAIKPGM